MNTEAVAQLLAAVVSPMLVISAAGLLLLSMTNRYGRVIDRARTCRHQTDEEAISGAEEELQTVWRRARLLRLAITLTTVSVLGVVLTVFALFIQLLTRFDVVWLVPVLFGASLIALGASLIVFLRDMTLSLRALEIALNK